MTSSLHPDFLRIDCPRETDRILRFIRRCISSRRREGIVIGLSGGIDSAVTAELAVRALGKERVLGLILPERESSPESRELALRQSAKLGIQTEVIGITGALAKLGVYRERDNAIREVYPYLGRQDKVKITLPPDLLTSSAYNVYRLFIRNPRGQTRSRRLTGDALRAIIAATNIKQRTRAVYLYFAAEKMNFLVCGTTNRTEYVLGFFVKYGDGGVDLEPIAHLYKTQVGQLADYLNVIEEIRTRVPTPDTFSIEVSDEEFYFRIPYGKLDFLLSAWEQGVPAEEAGKALQLNGSQVTRAYRDFAVKHRVTDHQRKLPPLLKPISPRQAISSRPWKNKGLTHS